MLSVTGNANEQSPEVSVVALTIENDPDDIFNRQKTQVEIRISTDSDIFKIDKEKSKLNTFTDNLGVDLIDKGISKRQRLSYISSNVIAVR